VLSVMDNRKKKGEEPEAAVAKAMAQADLVIISARYSLEDTNALKEAVAQGSRYVAIGKSLRIISTNIDIV